MATSSATLNDSDPEIQAISLVYSALKGLDAGAQQRVLDYVSAKLGLRAISKPKQSKELDTQEQIQPSVAVQDPESDHETELDGISPVAAKWIKRSGFDTVSLGKLFSLGMDEIDLVAQSIPGEQKKERMHNVLLLKTIAEYLSSGAARVSHEQLKETCLHYDAYDAGNFAKHLKSFNAEINGTKESGYTLTPRGMTGATELIREIITTRRREAK